MSTPAAWPIGFVALASKSVIRLLLTSRKPVSRSQRKTEVERQLRRNAEVVVNVERVVVDVLIEVCRDVASCRCRRTEQHVGKVGTRRTGR